MNKNIAILISLFLVSKVKAQDVHPSNGDRYFKQATMSLFENDLGSARSFFDSAFTEFRLDSNFHKMNECTVAKAFIEFTNGNLVKSLEIFEASKEFHKRWCEDDHEGLKIIEDSILICKQEISRSLYMNQFKK